jgi:hypothetical protein
VNQKTNVMQKILYLFILLFSPFFASAQTWTQLATDPGNDGVDATLLDATNLSYRYVPSTDSLFVKINVAQGKYPLYGVNIIFGVNNPAAGAATYWGSTQNTNFIYNRILTEWSYGVALGIGGIADAIAFSNGDPKNLCDYTVSYCFQTYIDTFSDHYIYRIKLSDIFPSDTFDANIMAAVGSNLAWNDDIPNSGSGHIFIVKNPTAISSISNDVANNFFVPNPGSGVFLVQNLPDSKRYKANILNSIGQTVYREEVFNGFKIHLENLPNGVYFVHLESDGYKTIQRIILNK